MLESPRDARHAGIAMNFLYWEILPYSVKRKIAHCRKFPLILVMDRDKTAHFCWLFLGASTHRAVL
jgi:hypothetical protein